MAEIHQQPRRREPTPTRIEPERQPVAWKPWPDGTPDGTVERDEEFIDCPPHGAFYHIPNLRTARR